uniref:Uncharacterized protein n=1 Tax=Catagonus wagneri TaxID=51154 RepID=A0A8C3WS85_9CETA
AFPAKEAQRGLTSSCSSKTMAHQDVPLLTQILFCWSKRKSPGW